MGRLIATEDRAVEEINRETVGDLHFWMGTVLSRVSPRAAEELVKGAALSLGPSMHDGLFAPAEVFCELIRSEVLNHPRMLAAIEDGKRKAREFHAKREAGKKAKRGY